MRRREFILAVVAIPAGAAMAARPLTKLVFDDFVIEPLVEVSLHGGGFLLPKEFAEEMIRLYAIPPELIGRGEK